MTVTQFSRFCGPQALHAVLTETPERARPLPIACAGLLRALDPDSPPSTSARTMARALRHYGRRFTRVDPRTGASRDTPHWFRPSAFDTLPEPAAAAITQVIDSHAAAAAAERRIGAPTVFDWLRRPGTWLIVAGGDDAHWLAQRDHRVIAGDDAAATVYGDWPVIDALELTP